MERQDNVMRAVLIGYPIKHSLSPVIFGELSKYLDGVQFSYGAEPVPPEDLAKYMSELKSDEGMVGCNVTHPHKVAVMDSLDEVAPEAKAVGAVNVVKALTDDDGTRKLKGYNTDVYGIRKVLDDINFPVESESAVVYGAGGAARAVAACMGDLKVKTVYIVNRTLPKATIIGDAMKAIYPQTEFIPMSLETTVTDSADIYLNATTIGMKDKIDMDILPKSISNRDAVIFDLVYGKDKTSFLKAGERNGLKTISGLDMLVWQAAKTFETWFQLLLDEKKVKDDLKSLCLDHLNRRDA